LFCENGFGSLCFARLGLVHFVLPKAPRNILLRTRLPGRFETRTYSRAAIVPRLFYHIAPAIASKKCAWMHAVSSRHRY
jgi:hypothetical protein